MSYTLDGQGLFLKTAGLSLILFTALTSPAASQTWDFSLSAKPEAGNPDGQGTSLDAYLGLEWPGGLWSSSLSASTVLLNRTEKQAPPERLLLTETSALTEIFFRALEYRLVPGVRLGLGLYQTFEDQLQSGYFRTGPVSPFQAFTLDFKGRSTGPLVSASWSWQELEAFRTAVSVLAVPVFWASVYQTYVLEPALEGAEGLLDYGTWGGPYIRLKGEADLWKYVTAGLAYDVYSLESRRLKVGAGTWVPVTEGVWSHALLWTLGVNLPLGGSSWVQIGAGRKSTWIIAPGNEPLVEGRTVLDLSFSLKD